MRCLFGIHGPAEMAPEGGMWRMLEPTEGFLVSPCEMKATALLGRFSAPFGVGAFRAQAEKATALCQPSSPSPPACLPSLPRLLSSLHFQALLCFALLLSSPLLSPPPYPPLSSLLSHLLFFSPTPSLVGCACMGSSRFRSSPVLGSLGTSHLLVFRLFLAAKVGRLRVCRSEGLLLA